MENRGQYSDIEVLDSTTVDNTDKGTSGTVRRPSPVDLGKLYSEEHHGEADEGGDR